MTQHRKRYGGKPGSERIPRTAMPTPGSFGTDGEGAPAAPGPGMPRPRMAGAPRDDDMPRPDRVSADMVSETLAGASGQMPIPSFAGAPQATSAHSSPGGGGRQLPRFGRPDGQATTPSYEPGVVEVQFREAVSPRVIAAGPSSPAEIRSSATSLSELNRILQRYHVASVEPIFLIIYEEVTAAQTVARDRGIDALHLVHFVTLRFPSDTDVHVVAEEL